MASRTALSCSLIATVLAVLISVAESGVNVTIYNIDTETFVGFQVKFIDAVTAGTVSYCSNQDNMCPPEFNSVVSNITTKVEDIRIAKPNVNVTVTILATTNSTDSSTDDTVKLSTKLTTAVIVNKADEINKQTGHQIVEVGHEFIGLKPDNPANWIIIAIFAALTIVLLLVVIYLSKNKVNHANEHYEQMKRDSSADGEIAA